jgi:Peroxidase, family 2
MPANTDEQCPAQNALANHGYLDRSGFTTFADCVTANTKVFNLGDDLASFLCFMGLFTGGGLGAVPFSIGNSTAVQNTITNACPISGLLGNLLSPLCIVQNFLNQLLGAPGFGLAQTHNAFEGDSSFLQPDWETTNGMDASTIDMSAFNKLWTKRLADGTFDDYQIMIDWASYRKSYSIATNPCYFRAPFATVIATTGAYTFVPNIFANFTPENPDGTLTGSTLASFFSVALDQNGSPTPKGLGKEQIPSNW